MTRLASRHTSEAGLVLPTGVLVASICAVVIAALGFVLTSHPSEPAPTARIAAATPATTAAPPVIKAKHKATVKKSAVYVEVFNNSNLKGLAGRTAAKAQNAGWNVVGSDNWYGTIDASTVYYPQRLAAAARLLAKDLGIGRLKVAIAPMKLDRLTVILTTGYRP